MQHPPLHLPSAPAETLRARALLLRQMRAFFDSQGFLEVHTPCLMTDTVIDLHLQSPSVPADCLGPVASRVRRPELFLQTSPEFAMKRLLAGGMKAIYQIGPAFRVDERGPYHNPEFTIAEWYRVGDGVEEGIALLASLATTMLNLTRCPVVTYAELMRQHAGVDPRESDAALIRQAVRQRVRDYQVDDDDTIDDCLNILMDHVIQPAIANHSAIIIRDYPATQSALAEIDPMDNRIAHRFELFCGGVELANGYGELTDADQMIDRFETINQQRISLGRRPLPTDSLLAAAMRDGIPACSGCALGFDRLLMVATGHSRIDQVMAFPIERA
ncbi:MAG: EF-P lysine aminoacylase EpmA [Planctomycetota bacterium]